MDRKNLIERLKTKKLWGGVTLVVFGISRTKRNRSVDGSFSISRRVGFDGNTLAIQFYGKQTDVARASSPPSPQ